MNKQFKRLKKQATPSRTFRLELLSQLQSEFKQPSMQKQSFARYSAVGLVSVLIVFGFGTGVYAYESTNVVEGHPLNVVKENIEDMEWKIADWQGRPAQFHAKMAERRLNEIERHQADAEQVDHLLTITAEHLGLTVRELHEDLQDPESRADVLERLIAAGGETDGLVQKFIDFVEAHGSEDRPKLQRFMDAGIGDEVSEIRQELKDSELSNTEKRDVFQGRMKELLDAKKEQVDARRNELQQQNLEDKEIRDQLREEFGLPPRGPKGSRFEMLNQQESKKIDEREGNNNVDVEEQEDADIE